MMREVEIMVSETTENKSGLFVPLFSFKKKAYSKNKNLLASLTFRPRITGSALKLNLQGKN
jgi:hypothetical protein